MGESKPANLHGNSPALHELQIRPARMDELELVRRLFRDYQAELGIDLCFQDFEQELAALPGRYTPPGGALLLAELAVQPAGCVAVRPLAAGICELKRMYVRPESRRCGVGRGLAEAAIDAARAAGYRRMRLDTLATMTPAMRLYQSLGFVETEPYCFNPHETARYFELRLIPD
jgi:putative acetyltransferase